MIWRKKLQNQISIVLWLIAMIMLIFRLMDMELVVDNLKHKVKTKFSDIETDDSDIEYFEAKNNNGDEKERYTDKWNQAKNQKSD